MALHNIYNNTLLEIMMKYDCGSQVQYQCFEYNFKKEKLLFNR